MDAVAEVLEYPKVLAWAASFANSALGRQKLQALRPMRALPEVQAAAAELREMLALLGERDRLGLTGLTDLTGLLEQAHESGLLEGPELRAVALCLRICRELVGALSALSPDEFPRLLVLARDMPVFPELEGQIIRSLDADGVVLDTASPRLPSLRNAIGKARSRHRAELEKLLRNPQLAKALQNPKPTLRGDRSVLSVKKNFRGLVPGILHGLSQTGQTLFIEPARLVELGNALAEAIFAERQEVERILRELTRAVLEAAPGIGQLTDRCGTLDMIHAKALMAREHAMVVPELSAQPSFRFVAARHPLLLMLAEGDASQVVPADIRLGHDFDMLLITGPNTGGKTVALKTVGLLQLMAQAGLPIPAAPGSQAGIFSEFYADIGDEQSLQQSLSTFSSHVVRLRAVVESAGERSLVLLDELGSGTDPSEGAALSRAILEHLVQRGARCMVTTHIGELKDFCLAEARAMNASVEFDLESLQPTYRFLLGQPGNSNAVNISRRLGLPEPILERASALLETVDSQHSRMVEKMTRLAQDAEVDREQAARALERAEASEQQLQARLQGIEVRKLAVAQEADRDAEKLGGALRKALDELPWLEQMPRRWKEEVWQLRHKLLQLLERSPFEERRAAWAQSLKKGRSTYVISYGKVGTVTRINKGRKKLRVSFGRVEVDTDFDDVSWIGTEEVERRA